MTKRGPAKLLQMSDGRLRASTQNTSFAGLRAVTTHPFGFSFSSARGFPFIQPCKVRSSKGMVKGLWTNERPHAMVPHQRRRGIRHSLSLVLAPASTVPSGSKYDHDAAGTGGGAVCGYWMRGLFRHCCCRPEERCQSCPEQAAKLSQKNALVLVTSPR